MEFKPEAKKEEDTPSLIVGNLENAEMLAQNPVFLNELLTARLVQIAFGAGGASGVRAIELLSQMPISDSSEEISDEIDLALERFWIRVLEEKGYRIQPPESEGKE